MVKIPSTAFVRGLSKRTKLAHHYEKAWSGWDGPLTFTYSSKEKDDAFHPSGDCTPSSLALYNRILDARAGVDPDPISTTLRKAFLVGHFWHQVYQDLTVKVLELAEPDHIERTFEMMWDKGPYHWARGSADIAPCQVPGYGEYLVDFKTMNSRDFSRCQASLVPPNWSANKWECQMNIYMDWFKLERTLVLGINKDSPHDMIEFEYHFNQPLVDAIYEKWMNVSDCLDTDTTPIDGEDPPLPFQGVVST